MRVTKVGLAALLAIAIGTFSAKPAEAVQVLCEVSGDTGDHIVCPFYMVRESQSVDLPVAMQAWPAFWLCRCRADRLLGVLLAGFDCECGGFHQEQGQQGRG